MHVDNHHETSYMDEKYMIWFFAGGETRDDRFNIFTGSFIRLMKQILVDDFTGKNPKLFSRQLTI